MNPNASADASPAPLLPPDPTGRDGSRWSAYCTVDDIDVDYHIDSRGDTWWTCVQAQSDGTVIRTTPSMDEPIEDDEVRRRIESMVQEGYPYTLELTADDVRTIAFVGAGYAWSDALRWLDVGVTKIAEIEAWRIKEACESDTEGGHSMFPMLDLRSNLASKLTTFLDSIV